MSKGGSGGWWSKGSAEEDIGRRVAGQGCNLYSSCELPACKPPCDADPT